MCCKVFTTVKRLVNHMQDKHPGDPSATAAPTHEDGIFLYTKSLITLGLMRYGLMNAIRHADGDLVFQLFR